MTPLARKRNRSRRNDSARRFYVDSTSDLQRRLFEHARRLSQAGKCVHKLKANPQNSDALYQQNQCGAYRADFTGDKWRDISRGLPTQLGFAFAVPAAEVEGVADKNHPCK